MRPQLSLMNAVGAGLVLASAILLSLHLADDEGPRGGPTQGDLGELCILLDESQAQNPPQTPILAGRASVSRSAGDRPATATSTARTAALNVRVQTPEGAFVPDAAVWAVVPDLNARQGPLRTDRHGRARWTDLDACVWYVAVQAPGRRAIVTCGGVDLSRGRDREITVTLHAPDASIVGRVLGPNGEPLTDVVLHAARARLGIGSGDLDVWQTGVAPVRADAAGRYELADLPPGTYVVTARATSHRSVCRILAATGTRSADMTLRPVRPVRVCGRVVDEDGEPLAGVLVQPDCPHPPRTRSAEDGSFELELDRGARAWLDLRFRSRTHRGHVERLTFPAELPSTKRDLLIKLAAWPRLTVVSGVVTSPSGESVPDARIRLFGTSVRVRRFARTASDGSFRLDAVPPGIYRFGVIGPVPFQDHRNDAFVVPPEGVDATVTLSRREAAWLTGRIVSPSGSPIPRFRLEVRSLSALGSSTWIAADDDGRYEVAVSSGALSIETLGGEGHRVEGVRVRPAERRVLDLVLDRGTATIRGSIRDAQGVPVRSAHVRLSWVYESDGLLSTSSRRTRADSSGSFRFEELAPGRHTLMVSVSGRRRMVCAAEASAGSEEIVVRLAEPESREGKGK